MLHIVHGYLAFTLAYDVNISINSKVKHRLLWIGCIIPQTCYRVCEHRTQK